MIKTNNDLTLSLYRDYIQLLGYGIDGYVERLIRQSDTYLIEDLGFFSVYEQTLVGLHFFDQDVQTYKKYLDAILSEFDIDTILFPSNDKVLMTLYSSYDVLDQAYNYLYPNPVKTDFKMKVATASDKEGIYDVFGAFLNYNEVPYDDTIIYYHKENDDFVSLGFYEKYLIDNRACVAMIVNEQYRKKGYGTKTLHFLVQELQQKNIKVNARCYVLNHASRKTLLKAGFIDSNKLLKIELKKQHS